MIRAKTPQRTLLVSDAVTVAGCLPGTYELNGEPVVLSEDGRVFQPGTPWLAGSSATLDCCVANAARFTGLTLEEILLMATTQPARYLGLAATGRVTADWNAADCRLSNLKVFDV
jgi:N-acetylglucosamine-6-phosphate deacetylase